MRAEYFDGVGLQTIDDQIGSADQNKLPGATVSSRPSAFWEVLEPRYRAVDPITQFQGSTPAVRCNEIDTRSAFEIGFARPKSRLHFSFCICRSSSARRFRQSRRTISLDITSPRSAWSMPICTCSRNQASYSGSSPGSFSTNPSAGGSTACFERGNAISRRVLRFTIDLAARFVDDHASGLDNPAP